MRTDDLIDEILMDIPAPRATIREAISRSARRLCTEADVWVQRREPVVVAANTDYPQIAAADGEPLRIRYLTIDGRKTRAGEGWDQPEASLIVFQQKPKQSLIFGELACRPEHDDMPPDDVVDRWAEVIEHGARYRLLMMHQAWANPNLAAHHDQRFMSGVFSARQYVNHGHARGTARVKARRFI
ncbi:hypothetical protein ACSEE7_12640 [Halomonas cupida]|uniref:hypothetical protein n=1 Tax=Halomonas cupida TaxID=44933 RepID=UPI003EF4549A